MRCFLVLGALAACHGAAPPPATDLEGLTSRLVDLDRAYWASGKDAAVAEELRDVAAARAPLWDAVAASDPARALRTTVPVDIAIALPPDIAPLVERSFERTDIVQATLADDFEHGTATLDLAFDAGTPGMLALHPVRSLHPRSGERLHAIGYAHGSVAALSTLERANEALAGIQWAPAEKALVVVMRWTDRSSQYSTSQVSTAMTGAASYFSQISGGEVQLTSTVVGIYAGDIAQTCDFNEIQGATYRALAANAVDTTAYNQIVAVVPSSCSYTGKSEVGQVQNGRATFSTVNDTGALAHELGHAHGLYHPHSMSCPGSDLAADETTCTTVEYGHPTDLMAHGAGAFDAFAQWQLGYVGRPGFGSAQIATASGSYTLAPIAGTLTNSRLLVVPYQKDTLNGWARSFYVEYHVATGLDGYLSATNMDHKVLVNVAIDADLDSGYYLKALAVGDTFTAPNGTTMTVTAADDSGATINVVLAAASTTGCVRAKPVIVLNEESIETPNTAGSTTQYQVEIWNHDSTECPVSTFSLSSSDLPAGWTLTTTPIPVYPTGLGNSLYYVTSPATATGTTTFTLTASDPTDTSGTHTTTTTTTFVASTCTPVPPTVTFTPASATMQAGGSASYLLAVTNNNDSSCGDLSIGSLQAVVPTGWTMTGSGAFTIAPGATASAVLTYTAPATATGSSTVGVIARYFVNGHNWARAVVGGTATIGTACVHAPPQLTISPTTQSSTSATELDYTVSVENIDGDNCPTPEALTIAVTPPAGLTATLDTTTFSLAHGATGTTTLRMTPTTTTVGDYTATVTASSFGQTTTRAAVYRLSCGSIVSPTVKISPSTQSGQPGDTLTYAVAVTNPNTSTLCGSRTYTLTSTVTNLNGTTGWTTSLAASTLTIASGATATTTMTVTSPADAAAPWAVYKPQVHAADDLGHGATASAFYSIQCLSNPPTLTLNPASASATPGSDVPMLVTITDNDTHGCPWTMDMWSTLPSGWTESTLPTSVTLSGGTSSTVTWTPHIVATAAGGTYAPKVFIDNAGVQSSATASVTVTCPGHVAPTVAVSPASQTGTPGAPLDYTVTVTNNDPPGCVAQDFALTDAIPSGWSGAFDTSTLTVARGASDTATLTVTSATGASGSNPVFVTATGTASGAASASATYDLTCTPTAPKVTLSPTSQSGAAGATLSYTATIKNQSSGCAAATYTLTPTVPSGWTGSLSSTSLTLASGSSTSVVLSATSAATATGTNSVDVSATDGTRSGSGTASYVIACTRAAPSVTLAPSTQSASPGTALSYTATIRNNDSGCTSGTFSIAKSLPTGWSGSVSSSSITLASGASTTVTLSATAPTSASGSNAVGVTASNAASGATTGTAAFVVTCTPGAPTVTLSPTTKSGAAGSALTYTATIKNGDSGCAAQTVTLAPSVPSGWAGALSATTLTLSAGATGTTTLTATSTASATGTNTVGVTATDTSGTTTGPASYVVTAGCTRAAPAIAVTPATQSGTPGTGLAYTVTVTDNDSAGCASGTFTLARTLPATPPGWMGTFSASSLTLAPGAQGTSTLTVTSPAMVMPASYNVTATVSNASSGSASTTLTYQVAQQCTRQAPTVALSPLTQSAVAGTPLDYTATITNHDTACGTSTFTIAGTGPGGWTIAVGQTSLTLGSGSSTTLVVTATSPAAATAATYSIGATASDATSGSGSGTASYVVTPSCVRSAPSIALAPTMQSSTAGGTLTYTATITNHDTACASETFTIDATGPSGWSLAGGTITLASGASGTVAVSATSAVTAAPASYTISASATGTSGAASTTATYDVSASCVRAAPTVAITPASQAATAGSAANYSVTITNHDSACGSGSFALTSSLPGGWTGVFATTPISLASGASTSVMWTVTSSASATAGDIAIDATAANAASGSGSGSATYTVTAPCVRALPLISIAPTSQAGAAGSTLVYTATITNEDTACSTEMVTLAHAEPTGLTGTLATSSVTLASGASTTVEYDVTSDAAMAATNATVQVSATGIAGTATATATDSVTATCVRHAPTLALAPASQTGAAGASLVYTATLTNADVGCAADAVAATTSAPTGWTLAVGALPATLASGASTQVAVTVTSPGDAVGDQTFGLTATLGARTASATATYAVACSHAPPMLAITPATQSGAAGTALTYDVAVTSATSGCADEVVTLAATAPAGFSAPLAQTTITLGHAATMHTTLTATSPDTASAGDYGLEVTAAGAQNASAQATYTVIASTPPGPRGKSGGCAVGGDPGWALVGLVLLRRRRRRT